MFKTSLLLLNFCLYVYKRKLEKKKPVSYGSQTGNNCGDETIFPKPAVIFPDFSLRISLGTFYILLSHLQREKQTLCLAHACQGAIEVIMCGWISSHTRSRPRHGVINSVNKVIKSLKENDNDAMVVNWCQTKVLFANSAYLYNSLFR